MGNHLLLSRLCWLTKTVFKPTKISRMLLVATFASLTCVTLATPLHRVERSTPGGSAICSAAEAAFSSAKGEGKSDEVAGAVAAKGMADYFNEFGKSVITKICEKTTLVFLDARISGANKTDALKAAATTYTDNIADHPDPDSACFKSQDSL